MSAGYVGNAEYASIDETARLVLMENPKINMIGLFEQLCSNHPDLDVTVGMVGDIWRRYRGMDGRTRPTHDIESGAPLRGRW